MPAAGCDGKGSSIEHCEHFAFTLTSAGGPGLDLSIPLSSVGHRGLSGCLELFQDPAVMLLLM